MKCQKCGVNEVSFHHSSNVNGCVTETHLCSQCAMESGYDLGQMFDLGGLLDTNQLIDLMFPAQRGVGGFMPVALPVVQSSNIFPFTVRPITGKSQQGTPCECGCGKSITHGQKIEVDEEMKIRRELNAQMRTAVANEEFEKAAELRDKIKALEITGTQETTDTQKAERRGQCDSETTTQDSPTVQ